MLHCGIVYELAIESWIILRVNIFQTVKMQASDDRWWLTIFVTANQIVCVETGLLIIYIVYKKKYLRIHMVFIIIGS